MDDSSEPVHPAIRGLKAVCRCNNVKYRTIERAIREGAKSVADIAVRTTATTGYCGGTCTPEVQEMLDELGCGSKPAASAGAPADAWWIRPTSK